MSDFFPLEAFQNHRNDNTTLSPKSCRLDLPMSSALRRRSQDAIVVEGQMNLICPDQSCDRSFLPSLFPWILPSFPPPSCLPPTDSSPREMEKDKSIARDLPNVRFRVLIAGRANAGKTTILQRVCETTDSPEIWRTTVVEGKEIREQASSDD